MVRHPYWLNLFRYGRLSWQYFSHRVLRWTLAPFALFALLPLNFFLWEAGWIYQVFLIGQGVSYLLAGWGSTRYQKGQTWQSKVAFSGFYFIMMHAAVWVGWSRFLLGRQSVNGHKINH